jgi:YidC/Oxa1 family membrane protein insertase
MSQDQKPNNYWQRMGLLLLLYIPMTFFMWQMWQKQAPQDPGKTESIVKQAADREKEGRAGEYLDSNGKRVVLDRAERVKRLEESIKLYDQIWNEKKNTPEGYHARFQPINIYDFLAKFEGERAGTKWFDQAEQRLKELENQLHGKTGSIQLEVDGEVQTKEGPLDTIATERLNSIRAARDERNKSKITYRILDTIIGLLGRQSNFSYWFALVLIVVVLKTLTFPFAKRQHLYMLDMARLQPLFKKIQEEMKNRPQEEVQKRLLQVQRENNFNMAAGCLPMLVLMFVLFPVFWMIRDYEYQFTNGTWLWIGSPLSQQYWWLGKNLAQFDVPLFVIYLLSNVVYSLMQPKPADPQQAQQQKMMMFMMPLMFGWFMWSGKWSSAFMFYWLVLNMVSMYQSWLLKKRYGTAQEPKNVKPIVDSSSSGENGGGPKGGGSNGAANASLSPMKGVHTAKGNGKKKRRGGPQSMLGGMQPPDR